MVQPFNASAFEPPSLQDLWYCNTEDVTALTIESIWHLEERSISKYESFNVSHATLPDDSHDRKPLFSM